MILLALKNIIKYEIINQLNYIFNYKDKKSKNLNKKDRNNRPNLIIFNNNQFNYQSIIIS